MTLPTMRTALLTCVCHFYGVHAYTSYCEVDLELVIAMVCSGLCLIGLDLLYFWPWVSCVTCFQLCS